MRSLIVVLLAPLGAVVLADVGNSTYACGRLDRVGPASEGGKYVCGLETLSAGCVVYSFGISGDSRFESYLLQHTPCEVHAFDPTIAALPLGTHLVHHETHVGLRVPRTAVPVPDLVLHATHHAPQRRARGGIHRVGFGSGN